MSWKIGQSVIMIGDAGGDWRPVPAFLHVYVPDVDEVYGRALELGAEPVQPPERKADDQAAGAASAIPVATPGGSPPKAKRRTPSHRSAAPLSDDVA